MAKKKVSKRPEATCDACGKKLKWDPDASVSIHISMNQPQAEALALLGAKTTKEALAQLTKKVKRMKAMVGRVGNIPTGISLSFCSIDCLTSFTGHNARRKLMAFAREHARSGLVYRSSLFVAGKDPWALLRLLRVGGI